MYLDKGISDKFAFGIGLQRIYLVRVCVCFILSFAKQMQIHLYSLTLNVYWSYSTISFSQSLFIVIKQTHIHHTFILDIHTMAKKKEIIWILPAHSFHRTFNFGGGGWIQPWFYRVTSFHQLFSFVLIAFSSLDFVFFRSKT